MILVFFLILYFWEPNLYSRFLIFGFGICYQFCTFKNPIFSTHCYLGVWLPAWLLSPLWLSFFSLKSPLSPPSHFSSLLNSESFWVFRAVQNTYGTDYWLSWSLSFWLPLLSSWSLLSPSSLFFSLCNSMNLSECSRLWREHRELITGWTALFPFDSPSSPGHFCFPHPSSLFHVTLTSLGVPHCGDLFHH